MNPPLINAKQIIDETIAESINVKKMVSENLSNIILDISNSISDVLFKGGTVYLFGNGGSAADAQHVAAELVGRFTIERNALAAEALTTNTSTITAIGNDYDFTEIFSRQVKARVCPADIVVGISTSGKSQNVIKGLKSAREIGAKTIGFTGSEPHQMNDYTDICLCVPSNKTSRIQEAHILIWHIVCDLVEKNLA